MGNPVKKRAKIQPEVLVPLIKALQAESGEERANDLPAKHQAMFIVASGNGGGERNDRGAWETI